MIAAHRETAITDAKDEGEAMNIWHSTSLAGEFFASYLTEVERIGHKVQTLKAKGVSMGVKWLKRAEHRHREHAK